MARKQYDTVRISPEAKEKLRQLSEDSGIPMSKSLDRLLNVEIVEITPSSLDTVLPMLGITQREFLSDIEERNFQNEQDLKEAFAKLDAVSQEIDVKKLQQETVIDAIRNEIPTKPTKPPSAIIDASILYSFKQLGKKKLTRKDIKAAVITMMQESNYPTTWAGIYDRWWENHSRNKSKFELDFDNRLRRLVKDGLISNKAKSGEYSHNLTTKHWDYVEQLATGFYPQIVIDKIGSIKL